jgi:hypothetical protein
MAPRESLRKEPQHQSPDWAKSLVVCSTQHERRHSSLDTRDATGDAVNLHLHESFACDEDSRMGLSIRGPSDSVSDMSSFAGASQLQPVVMRKNSNPLPLPVLLEKESGINQRLSKSTAVPVTPDTAASALGIAQRLVGDLAVLCQEMPQKNHHNNTTSTSNNQAPPKELLCPEGGDHSVSAISTPSTLLRYPDSPLHTVSRTSTDTTVSSYGSSDDSNPQFGSSVGRFSSMRRYQKLQVQATPALPPKERKVRRTFSLPIRQNSQVACAGTPNTEETSPSSKQAFPQSKSSMYCGERKASLALTNTFTSHSLRGMHSSLRHD